MTLHAAKGLEFDLVFLPGWEEGLFPHQRALDENGRAGLEEERRLAYVGITRARRAAQISFAANRHVHGLWQSSPPSRFIDELPVDHVEAVAASSGALDGYAAARFAREPRLRLALRHAGLAARARERRPRRRGGRRRRGRSRRGRPRASTPRSAYVAGARVFHLKFGPGSVVAVDGAKLTVDFDRAGRKTVLDSFVSAAG